MASLHNEVQKLYIEHRNWLSLFIQRRTGCSDTTADLVQDTYLRLLSTGRIPAEGTSRRFLAHIAKGLVIDNYRRKRIEENYLDYLASLPEDQAPSPEERLMMVQRLNEMDRLLHGLSNKARLAFLWHRLEGLSYKDIATRLAVSVSSVEKYIVRALQTCLAAQTK